MILLNLTPLFLMKALSCFDFNIFLFLKNGFLNFVLLF
ncbi:hypothetical protein HPSA20_1341 [Helicobacter pylori SouthAfrica20]|uniref:Uncharacterized protein n=1 Tax=Helicobacter pylori SouthAfrica20 TaxID=1352356 RepID=T1UCB5_HELPX|nr:hypothetical protein HPSA20_1341 [Helicobacter pylori SouthAfrica20]